MRKRNKGSARDFKQRHTGTKKASSWEGTCARSQLTWDSPGFYHHKALGLALVSFYIPSGLLPNFRILAVRKNCILACCVITDIGERRKPVTWWVSGPANQKVGVNVWVCCLLLIRNAVPDVQRHPLGPLF